MAGKKKIDRDKLLAAVQEGMSVKTAARRFGVTVNTVYHHLKKQKQQTEPPALIKPSQWDRLVRVIKRSWPGAFLVSIPRQHPALAEFRQSPLRLNLTWDSDTSYLRLIVETGREEEEIEEEEEREEEEEIERASQEAADSVNHPPHYTQGKIEVIDFLEDQKLGFHESSAVKYVARARYKGNELGDLKKAAWYLNRKIQLLAKEDVRG